MKHWVSTLVRGLLRERDARALQETLADWRVEQGAAAGRLERLKARVRGAAAVTRVTATIAVDELSTATHTMALARALAIVGLVYIGLAVAMYLAPPHSASSMPPEAWIVVRRGWLLEETIALLPLAFGASLLWRSSEGVPVLGLGILFATATVVARAVVLPALDIQYPAFMARGFVYLVDAGYVSPLDVASPATPAIAFRALEQTTTTALHGQCCFAFVVTAGIAGRLSPQRRPSASR